MGNAVCCTGADSEFVIVNKKEFCYSPKSSECFGSCTNPRHEKEPSEFFRIAYNGPPTRSKKKSGRFQSIELRTESFISNTWNPRLDCSFESNVAKKSSISQKLSITQPDRKKSSVKISRKKSRKNTDAIWEAFVGLTTTSTNSSYVPLAMTEVHPHLYLGTFDDANNVDELKEKEITHILSLIGPKSTVKGVEHKHVPMNDYGYTDLNRVLKQVFEFMEDGQKDGNNLLVHCQSGQNRSATVVIAFKMMKFRKTLFLSHRELKMLRPIVQINVNYAKQLLELEKELFKVNSLPSNWMERGTFDQTTLEVKYRHENMTLTQHRSLFPESILLNVS